jgi:hypothetical protein
MNRKFYYLIALLVILAGAIGPALYMNKVFSSNQQNKQAESININTEEQGSAANQNRPAAGAGQTSPESDKARSVETKQGDPASEQKAAASNSASQENAATVQTSGDTAAPAAPESGCTVGIAIVGKNGELLYKAEQVIVKKGNKWGITALGALDATGIPYSTMPTWPDFIYSINGQANSGVSGWMYSVNGDTPIHMADKHPVKAGDKVIWWYSNSMDQPYPQWEKLA